MAATTLVAQTMGRGDAAEARRVIGSAATFLPLVRCAAPDGVYYRPTKAPLKLRPELAEPIKKLIEEEPSFGYRTVAALLGMNKNTVQRIFASPPAATGTPPVAWPT